MFRALFTFVFIMAISGCIAPSEHDEKFLISGGDGDQAILSQSLELVRIYPDWFDGKIYRGEDQTFIQDAYLTRVISDGEYNSRLIAITSRWVQDMDNQFQDNELASSIIHLIDTDFDNSKITGTNSKAVGMAVVVKID